MITTYAGKTVDPFAMKASDVDIRDIAHFLSMQCRFNGHCTFFYSVAEHCILVADLLPDSLKLEGLLHDATEAYLGDMPTPIKCRFKDFQVAEECLHKVIAEKFALCPEIPRPVISADRQAFDIEVVVLLSPPCNTRSRCDRVVGLTPKDAAERFLARFQEYGNV
jgi:5'-deoxynucleotidase YfbR-like HD superfamily hydrolase